MPQSRFGFCPRSATIFPFAEFWSTFSTALRIQCAGAVGDFPDYSPDATILFLRRTDRGRRHLLARSNAHGRVACFGWGPTGCRKAPLYDFLMSEGRRVWQSRRAEGMGPFSFSPVPKGGASLRATLAAVGSGQVAPLPALWRSFLARGRERFDPCRLLKPRLFHQFRNRAF
jgi:hypothetical protein